ncbi:hypothetical protein Hanom_Chr03g00198251 [Helianthus anomalus]
MDFIGNFHPNKLIHLFHYKKNRVNFRFAPCGLITLTVLPQTFKNSHFTP